MTEHAIRLYAQAESTLRITSLRQALYDEGAVLLGQTVVNLHGEAHKEKRTAVQTVFRRDFFRHYQNHIFPRALHETLDPCIKVGGGNLVDFAYRVLVNLVADSAGVDRRFNRADTDRLFGLIHLFGKAPTMGQMLAGDRDAMLRSIEQALDDFKAEFYLPSVTRRRELLARAATGEAVELPKDALTAMLVAYPNGAICEHDLARDTAFFILAGAFTTANVLMHTVYETIGWCEKHPGQRERLLADPELLQRCVWESVRLHPASPVAKRRATCPVRLPNADDAAAGDTVVVDLAAANRDPARFGADADAFNPNRELPPRTPRYGLSFGAGTHACLGRVLAAGLEINAANLNSEETEFGTLYLILRELLLHGIEKDPEHPPVIDESTTRRHFSTLPFVLRKPGR